MVESTFPFVAAERGFDELRDDGFFLLSAVDFFDASTSGWEVRTVDLSKYAGLEDGGASLRFVVDGATSGSGSIRFDNVVVSGSMVPAPGAAVLARAGFGLATRRRR